jgi:hypothetical protein
MKVSTLYVIVTEKAVFVFLIPCCEVRCDVDIELILESSLLPFVFLRVHVLPGIFVFIYVYRRPTRFLYHTMFVSFSSNRTGVTSGTRSATLPEHLSSPSVFSGVCVARSLLFWVVFCRS